MKPGRFIRVFLLTGLLALVLSGCVAKKYSIDYCGQKEFYRAAEDSYRAGQTVTVYYNLIATDTDYAFYLDGESLNFTYDESKGFQISFTMPDHDVTLECDSWNSSLPPAD